MSQELKRAKRKYAQGRKLFEQQNYFDSLMKLSKALESFNTIEPPSANLKQNLPSLYKTIKDCYVLSASCYIRMDQHEHAKNCLKLILKVEPSDAQSLYLRGEANEIRPETADKALTDFKRVYELIEEGRANTNLKKSVEAKLKRLGGAAYRSNVRKRQSTVHSNLNSELTMEGCVSGCKNSLRNARSDIFEIADRNRNSGNTSAGRFARLWHALKQPGRVKSISLTLIFITLVAIVIFVRKRQLLKRILNELIRLAKTLIEITTGAN